MESIRLKAPIRFTNVAKLAPAFCGRSPHLYQVQYLILDLLIHGCAPVCFKERDQIIHELAGGNFYQEMRTAIFNAGIRQL